MSMYIQPCSTCGKSFTTSVSEQELRAKMSIVWATDCVDCRIRNVLAFWPSIGRWYKRKCDFSGETIITNYPDTARFPVYKASYFESDKWTPAFSQIDLSTSFFSQLKRLQEKVPRPHMLGINNENCDYCDDIWSSKDCYLTISALEWERLYYSYRNIRCKNSTDLVFCFDCQVCHSLTNSTGCFRVFYGFAVENSSDSRFLYDCRNVKNCFMCWNLRDKQYCILNKQYTKDEYETKIAEINLGSRKEMKKLQSHFLEQIRSHALHRATMNVNCENVTGNFTTDSRDCENVNLFQESQSCANATRGLRCSDCLDSVGTLDSQLCVGICQSSYLYNVKYASYCANCRDSEYLDNCTDCSNCFGCVGLKHAQYCILNKQYSKEEYDRFVGEIKAKMMHDGEYGKFFPYDMMYSGYNTTLARLYYPQDKNDVAALGGYWEEHEHPVAWSNVTSYELPDDIKDVTAEVASKSIVCERTGNQFGYIEQVITFHKENQIPLSHVHHIERLTEMYYPLTFIQPYSGTCCIMGNSITHYYGAELGYKKIASNEAYDQTING